METILTPCKVPWSISPTDSGVTLVHSESMEGPTCTVVCGAGRLGEDDRTDDRRIEIIFQACFYARLGPHPDTEGIESIGYRVEPTYNGHMGDYLAWRAHQWRGTGNCPDSGFYVARQSAWLATLPEFYQTECRHYVVDGRDGYAEVIASDFIWHEWLGLEGRRDDAPFKGPYFATGEGVE